MHAKVRSLIFFIFASLFIQLQTPHAWGFSFSDIVKNEYLKKAQDKKLWLTEKWIRLGHYEKTWFGYKSDFRGGLFMAPKGYESPEQEMLATINAFFSESPELTTKYKRHPQCQFMARRAWLAQELNIADKDLLPCEERKAWKAELNAQSASLVFAASDFSNPASSFGHTFLKLVNPANAKNKDLIDYGVNYAAVADSSEGLFYAVKGLAGMYNGIFTMLPYHQKIREYINIEGRDIWEYPLDLTRAEVNFLTDHLLEMENASAPYYFFTGNCSYHILKTLEAVRPEMELGSALTSFIIPIDTVKVIERRTPLIKERIFKKSLKTDYIDSFSKLNLTQKRILDQAVQKLIITEPSGLDNKEKAEVYETAMKYIAIKAYRTSTDLDEEVYQLSSNRAALGPVTSDSKIRLIQPPDLSHDSSAVALGAGLLTSTDRLSQIPYYSLKFRSAFHELEQSDFGAIHMSQTELGSFSLRYYPDQKRTSLDRFTVINLINTNPMTQLENNISWKIRAELTDAWSFDTEVGGGASYDYALGDATRVAYLTTARYWQVSENNIGGDRDQSYLGAGPEILLITRPTSWIGFSTSLTYFGIIHNEGYLRAKVKVNFNIRQNIDIQAEAENKLNERSDLQIKVLNNFLF